MSSANAVPDYPTRFQPGNPGRAPVPIDMVVLERAAGIGCNPDELAALAGITSRQLNNRLKADPELAEAVERGRAMGRATLRRMQWDGAKNGNPAMLIWLGKQLLGQRDR